MEKITLKEIAKMAGVSVMTASNVIRGNDVHVSAETKTKIQHLINHFDYVPNQNAVNLRSGKSKLIGVLFFDRRDETDFTDPFISAVLTGIERAAKKLGYFIMIQTVGSTDSIEKIQKNWVFAGFIVIGARSHDFVAIDQTIRTPVSYVDTYWLENEKLSKKIRHFIVTDEKQVSEKVVRYLLKMGHKNILFHSYEFDENEPSVIEKRFAAFKKIFKELGGEHFEKVTTKTSSYSDVLKSVEPYLANPPFTAIYTTADILAAELSRIFKDISIVGVDNAEFGNFLSPKLTTIAINQIKKGEFAAEKLIQSLTTNKSYQHHFRVDLVERDSVKKIGGK